MFEPVPKWAYEVVMALQRWEATHPVLFQLTGAADQPVRTEACGCEALEFVPDHVKRSAAEITAYLAGSTSVDKPVDN